MSASSWRCSAGGASPGTPLKPDAGVRVACICSGSGAFLAAAMRAARTQQWVYGSYPDCQKAMQHVGTFEPNVALISLSDVDVDSAQKLKYLAPYLPMIMVSDKADQERILLSLVLGSRGYLIHPVSAAELVHAIARVGCLVRRSANGAAGALSSRVCSGLPRRATEFARTASHVLPRPGIERQGNWGPAKDCHQHSPCLSGALISKAMRA